MPLLQAVPFGLQHVLAMFVCNITPIIILASVVGISPSVSAVLIQNCMVIAGIGTLIQLYPVWRVGSRLPIVMGISFTFLSLNIAIATSQGMGVLMGAVIVGGIFPAVGMVLTTIPQAVLGGCSIMMFGSIMYAGFGMMSRCGFTNRNMIIVSLSLSIGLGFTQASEMFTIFPQILRTIFAENCVAVVFLLAVVLNLILPKEEETSK